MTATASETDLVIDATPEAGNLLLVVVAEVVGAERQPVTTVSWSGLTDSFDPGCIGRLAHCFAESAVLPVLRPSPVDRPWGEIVGPGIEGPVGPGGIPHEPRIDLPVIGRPLIDGPLVDGPFGRPVV